MIHPDIASLIEEPFSLRELNERELRRLLWMKLKILKNRLKDNDIGLEFDFNYLKEMISQLKEEKNKAEALNKKILSEITPCISGAVLKGEQNIKLCVEKSLS